VTNRRVRLARVPGLTEISNFLGHMRHSTRLSALRGVIDGPFVAWTLKKRGVRPLLNTTVSASARLDPLLAREVAVALDAGLALIPISPTCLRRSMTLARELKCLELAGTLHIGVRTVADRVEAHAWIQVGDVVVNDDPALTDTYAQLAAGELDTLLPLLK